MFNAVLVLKLPVESSIDRIVDNKSLKVVSLYASKSIKIIN